MANLNALKQAAVQLVGLRAIIAVSQWRRKQFESDGARLAFSGFPSLYDGPP